MDEEELGLAEFQGEGDEDAKNEELHGEGEEKGHPIEYKDEKFVLTEIPKTRFFWFKIRPNGRGYGPTFIDLCDMDLTNIQAVRVFRDIWYLDASQNRLDINSIVGILPVMRSLIYFNIDYNRLTTSQLECANSLTYLSMKHNLLKNIDAPNQRKLQTLLLDYNLIKNIENLDAASVPSLKVLSMRGNPIKSAAGLRAGSLRALFLNDCKIRNFDGLDQLPNLELLNLRNNKIRRMKNFPKTLTKLEYLNLRSNKIGSPRRLRFLKACPNLKTLIIMDNLFNDGDTGETGREGILIFLPSTIQRLDKQIVSSEERLKVTELMAFEGFADELEEEELEEEEVEEEEDHLLETDEDDV